jgi:outer membrane protein assembly factor BamD
MKKFLYASLAILSLVLLSLAGCSTTFDAAEAFRGESPEQIYAKGVDAMHDKNYQNAIKRFEALDVQYPYGRNTENAQLFLVYAYYITNDFASSEAAADRFIHTHPTNPHVDYAYFMRGLSNYYQNLGVFEKFFAVDLASRDLTQIKKSYTNFAELTRLFPRSRYAPAAHQYMIYLRNVMANYELHIAEYYYDRGAYVAAANRANQVVQQYQGAPAVPEALVIMVKSYRKLNLPQNTNEALSVLQYNFPRSNYLKRTPP